MVKAAEVTTQLINHEKFKTSLISFNCVIAKIVVEIHWAEKNKSLSQPSLGRRWGTP